MELELHLALADYYNSMCDAEMHFEVCFRRRLIYVLNRLVIEKRRR